MIVVTCDSTGKMLKSDEVWGFIGSDYARKELVDAMISEVKP